MTEKRYSHSSSRTRGAGAISSLLGRHPTGEVNINPEVAITFWFLFNKHHKSMEERVKFGLGGQLPLSGWPHNPTTTFRPPSTTWSLLNCFRTVQGHCGACQKRWWQMICAPVESHKRCLTSLIPVHWQSWLVACPSCTLQMMMLLRGRPTMEAHRGRTWQEQ